MTLLDILLHELESWPEGKEYAFQSTTSSVAYFESSAEDARYKSISLCQIASERGVDHRVTREEWQTAKIKSLPFFKDISEILGEERAVKELLAVGEISDTAKELDSAFVFSDTPQGFDFWRNIVDPSRGENELKQALYTVTAAMKKANKKYCIRLLENGSGSVLDSDNEIVYFTDIDSLVNKHLAPQPKFEHWDLLQDRFQWIAKDSGGIWWAYVDRPTLEALGWGANGDCRSLGSLKIDIPCHWSHSLIERPSHT